jgi:hypothetical protein
MMVPRGDELLGCKLFSFDSILRIRCGSGSASCMQLLKEAINRLYEGKELCSFEKAFIEAAQLDLDFDCM